MSTDDAICEALGAVEFCGVRTTQRQAQEIAGRNLVRVGWKLTLRDIESLPTVGGEEGDDQFR